MRFVSFFCLDFRHSIEQRLFYKRKECIRIATHTYETFSECTSDYEKNFQQSLFHFFSLSFSLAICMFWFLANQSQHITVWTVKIVQIAEKRIGAHRYLFKLPA